MDHGPKPVSGETFDELSAPSVHTNFLEKKKQQSLQSCGPATQWKTGRTTKMGKKWEKRGKFAPIENGEKMAEKYRKNSEAQSWRKRNMTH